LNSQDLKKALTLIKNGKFSDPDFPASPESIYGHDKSYQTV